MRKILFRGKSIQSGRWRKGDLMRANGDKLVVGTTSWCAVRPDTIGQYTGLNDKNGQRIFESDILKYDWRNGEQYIGEVVWDSEYACFDIKPTNGSACHHFGLMNSTEFEVIGNIHDNPELLKAEVKE